MASPLEAGGKGAGLLRLPPVWYPPTLLLPPDAHALYRQGRLTRGFLTKSRSAKAAHAAISALAKHSPGGEIYLRSSASTEGMGERGKFESRVVAGDVRALETCVLELWSKYADFDESLGFVVQPHLAAMVSGHLSNEHRVSRDMTAWLSELGVGTQSQQKMWRVSGASAADDGPLLCPRLKSLEPGLRRVARRLSDSSSRHHLEWIWDGEKIWVVQADVVPRLQGPAPGDAWLPSVGRELVDAHLKHWRDVEFLPVGQLSDWPKVEARSAFTKAGLPVAKLWRLAGQDLVQALASGSAVPGLIDDLELICSGHIVVRTDARGPSDHLMLAKTGTESDPVVVEKFLRDTCRYLLDHDIAADDISFLAHRYLRARACAWTFASPNDPYVEVDSMWGTADGLAWLPHDSAWVNVDTGEVRRSIEGKTVFLDVAAPDSWTYRETPTEWIWRGSMTDDQLRTIAAGASRLAKNAGRPTNTMWFVGMLDGADVDCLPWFQTSDSLASVELAHPSPSLPRAKISSANDLAEYELAPPPKPEVLLLEPTADLVRDKSFIEEVIRVALSQRASVELVGSRLAHPFYLLREAGVAVNCVGQFNQPATPFNKLVRDNIVEMIESNGEAVLSYRATGSERARLLRLKVVEEAVELLGAQSSEDALEEIADVEEVVDALRSALGITKVALHDRRLEKRGKRGGFDDGLVLVNAGKASPPDADQLEGFAGNFFEAGPWQVQQRSDRVILSVVPPLPGEQHSFVLALGPLKLRIEYVGSQIAVGVETVHESAETIDIPLFEGES